MVDSYNESILKAVAYLEESIQDELTLDELAKKAAFSKFHFTRIFKAITKENVNEYIRKRRLTLAAKALIESSTPIIDLALSYGYASQEAFTRAFKSFSGLSPQSYRKKGSHHYNLYKEPLSDTMLYLKKHPVRHQAYIIEKPAFAIGGILLKGDVNTHSISKLWNQFYEELHKQAIDPDKVSCYGYESIDETNKPYYLAAIKIADLNCMPDGWIGKYIPNQKYAVFPLDNVIENISLAIEDIYKNQLPALQVEPVGNFSFEYYEEDFIAHDSSFTVQLFVPIR